MNLHQIVRGMIETVHKDETCILYQSLGMTNIKGKVKNDYQQRIVRCNVQPIPTALRQTEKYSGNTDSCRFYMYSDEELPVASIQRTPMARTGDFIYRMNTKQWYLVTVLIEDWSSEGWCVAECTLQTTPPDIGD